MKKTFLVGALAFGSFVGDSVAFAGQTEDIIVRLDAIEKENAAIRKENAALLENKRLREYNSKLKSAPAPASPALRASASSNASVRSKAGNITPPARATITEATQPSFKPIRVTRSTIDSIFDDAKEEKKDPFGSYAADLPVAYKASPAEHGQLRLWGEGGAIWTGGDPVQQNFAIRDFTNAFALFGGNAAGSVGQFDLTPKVGWEAATGFDYRFAGSPWHVSGQFRYGEGGKTSGSVASSGSFDIAALIGLLGMGAGGGAAGLVGGTIGGSETFSANYNERHWLADFAVGRDVFTSGRDAMQVKGGIRIAQYVDNLNTVDNTNQFFNFVPPINLGGLTLGSISTNTITTNNTRDSYFGAGPKVGIEGAIPFAGNWTLDYMGDAAILFGTERSSTTTTTAQVITPSILALLAGGNNSVVTNSVQRFSSVFSGDIQVGIGYWITPYMKLAASYRLDAMIHVQNTDAAAVNTLNPDRYWHGPRLTLSGQFNSL